MQTKKGGRGEQTERGTNRGEQKLYIEQEPKFNPRWKPTEENWRKRAPHRSSIHKTSHSENREAKPWIQTIKNICKGERERSQAYGRPPLPSQHWPTRSSPISCSRRVISSASSHPCTTFHCCSTMRVANPAHYRTGQTAEQALTPPKQPLIADQDPRFSAT